MSLVAIVPLTAVKVNPDYYPVYDRACRENRDG